MVHEKAWKSVTKAVQLDPKFIGKKYQKIGWVKKKHTWNICKCINIARELVFYDDIELLDADLKRFNKRQRKYFKDIWKNDVSQTEEAEAFIRLKTAGIISKLHELTFTDTYCGIDLSTVKNLSLLVQSVKGQINLDFVTHRSRDLIPKPKIFNRVNCKSFSIRNDASSSNGFGVYTDADIESLTEVLNDRVEEFVRWGAGQLFPSIEKYDGKGKCHQIELIYRDGKDRHRERIQFCLEAKKIKEWVTSRGWKFNVHKKPEAYILWRESKPTDCDIDYEYDENDTDEYVDL